MNIGTRFQTIELAIKHTLLKENGKTLIITAGQSPREYIEQEIPSNRRKKDSPRNDSNSNIPSDIYFGSIWSIVQSTDNVGVLFLDKVQYIFLYLTQLASVSKDALKYDTLIVFGLDSLLMEFTTTIPTNKDDENTLNKVEYLRYANLILGTISQLATNGIDVILVPFEKNQNMAHTKIISRLIEYWNTLY
ncbi:hypothetical protein TBLA_0I00260 [Henningerozyma blattae CBS 6284]|uniref:DNA recombination and repair protein Rad51-like C-terminal domain-containing protein n=1 Tax=Henningerozyma blattae (strain ATCC 34711 / CBS 6284 / DSM 70876 / NBRC 10599 / NRRL Y-10934 / UCD 77-7) TaxID=1071380 RepID=I2H8I9_HENB6|nr:hypothetical protein TBLA_0I00260 [Tetrapisispora blattae CBS 6284]CCH62691.1 hypothetical protein TBLA_0I00260 [Tetrapisispora blattae CBS 6284]